MKFLNAGLLGTFASIVIGCAGAAAQESDLAKLTKVELDNKIVQARLESKGDPRAFCSAELLVRELDRREPNSLVRAEAEYFAAICALVHNNVPAMWPHIRNAEALLPISGGGQLRIAVESLALDVAAGTKDSGNFAEHIVHVAAIDDSNVLAAINGERIFANISALPPGVRDSAYLAFAESPHFSNYPGYFRQAIAEFSVLPALERGNRAVALKMVQEVSDIDHFYPLLIDRRYQPIWPEIERRVGPHMSFVADDFVRFSKQELAEEPDNRWAFGDVVRSLVVAGRNREAIAIFQTLPKDPQSVAKYQPGDVWATNAAAVALDREGRTAEADEAYDRLTQVSVETNPWMLSLLNIRAGRLIDQERWVNAMAASKDHLAMAERYGGPYQQSFAAANVICAATRLQSDPLVERANAILLLNSDKFPIAAAIAALCRNDKITAHKLVLAALASEDSRSLALINMQPPGAYKLPVAMRSALPNLSDFVMGDPELQAAFNRYGRILPSELHLRLSTERKP